MIKVILWDIDGTLLNFDESEKNAVKKCFSIFNLGECTDEMVKRYSEVNKKYWKMLEQGKISKQEVLTKRFQEFFKLEGINFYDIDSFNREYQVLLGDTVCFNDDSLNVVKRLKNSVKQYAVTNGTYIAQDKKLKKSGLIDVFDGVFISDKIGAEKPDKAFFDYVEKNIEKCPKSEIMIVGDSLTSDMQGGNNFGIVCCWYNPLKHEKNNGIYVDYEIQNLNQVEKIILNS